MPERESLMWSGPSRALQFHLEMFSNIQMASNWMKLNEGRSMRPESLPPTVQQRAMLQTAIGTSLNVLTDGDSVALIREKLDDTWTSQNIMLTALAMKHELQILNEGQTFYVSMHMAEMIKVMAEAMEPEPLFESDLPAKTGVIVFERPLIFPDLHPDTGVMDERIQMPVRAIGWNMGDVVLADSSAEVLSRSGTDEPSLDAVSGVEYMLWVDRRAYVDIYQRSLTDIGFDHGVEAEKIGHTFWKTDHSGWAFRTPWRASDDPEIMDGRLYTEEGAVHSLVAQQRRWLLAFFRLYFQRIMIPETYHPTKYEKKRALRMGRPLEDGYIKVVRLRRSVEAEQHGRHEGGGNHYDHQFIVSGHWRRQWYKSLGPAKNEDGTFNKDSHRLVWIDAHIKGPLTGPLVVGQQVQAVVR